MTNKLCYSGKKYNLEWGNYYYSMLLLETKDVSPEIVSPERDEQKRLNNGGDRKNEKSISKNRVDKRNPTCKRSLISISPSLSRQVQVIDPLENGARKIDLFDISPLSYKISIHAGVAELADALRSGRSEHSARESSNLSFGTIDLLQRRSFLSPNN